MPATNVSRSDSAHPDDRTLVAEFKRTRASEPFEVLFERYGKRLYGVAYNFHRRIDLAEDCVQETFGRAIEHIDRFGETNSEWNFWGWLVAIARDVCLSEWRRKQIRIKYAGAAESVATSRAAVTQEQQVMISEFRKIIRSLPAQCRVCYLLFFVEGYTYKEVARITGYAQETVKTAIQTAKRRIDREFRKASRSDRDPSRSATMTSGCFKESARLAKEA